MLYIDSHIPGHFIWCLLHALPKMIWCLAKPRIISFLPTRLWNDPSLNSLYVKIISTDFYLFSSWISFFLKFWSYHHLFFFLEHRLHPDRLQTSQTTPDTYISNWQTHYLCIWTNLQYFIAETFCTHLQPTGTEQLTTLLKTIQT